MSTQDFKDGKILRDGTDVQGTKYEDTVVDANSDPVVQAEETQAAYFEEQALDPYEIQNAQ